MALDKAIKHGKEHRTERYRWCRCDWCYGNRMHKHRKAAAKVDPQYDGDRDFDFDYIVNDLVAAMFHVSDEAKETIRHRRWEEEEQDY